MPIGDFEREIIRAIAESRNEKSFVAGATVIHQLPGSLRASLDVDLFHDVDAEVQRSAKRDSELLKNKGFTVVEELYTPTLVRAVVRKGGNQSKIEWVLDSPFRFFPVEKDPELGWKINFWDAATNKILALFSRHEFRDYVDALYLHENFLHLGALAWAAAGKDAGLTPEYILDWTKRSTRYTPDEITALRLQRPPDLRRMKSILLQACSEAETLFKQLPFEDVGCFYLDSFGRPVTPDPSNPHFSSLIRHFGTVGGSAPNISRH